MGATGSCENFSNREANSTNYHHQSTPHNLRNKSQAVVGGVGDRIEVELEHTHSRVLDGSSEIGDFTGQIGLGHRYKVFSTLRDLHFCNFKK